MKRKIISLTVIFNLLSIVFIFLHNMFYDNELITILMISLITTAYHFTMRLVVGTTISLYNERINVNSFWFKEHKGEKRLYKLLKVHKWKKYAPTFNKSLFDLNKLSLEDIVRNTCQAELVHEIIVILSFLPILAGEFIGGTVVFTITSVVAATLDLIFVIIQRYNRPRIIKVINRKKHSKRD